ncbi:MAG: TonB-dependent receptor, partial [Pseudohongiella sp.]
NGTGVITDTETREDKFDGGGWSGRVDWAAPVAAGRLELTGGANINDFEEWTQYVGASSSRRFEFEQDNRNADVGVRAEQTLSSATTLEARLIQNLRRSESVSTALVGTSLQQFDTKRDTGESILRSVLRWQRSDRLKIESSAELAYNMMDTTQSFTLNGQPVPLPLSTTQVNELRAEISSIATWQRSDTLTLEAGARLERSRIRQSGGGSAERSFFYPKPRLAMTWDFADNHQLRLRLERELGQLNFNDFAASSSLTNNEVLGGNLDLRPEQRWVSEAVFERRFSDEAVLSLTLRHDEISHVVDVLPLDDGLTAIGNIGDGTLDRAAIDVRLPLDRVGVRGGRLTLNARYDHARVTDPTTGHERQISEVRPFTGSVNVEQDLPTLNLVWGVNYTPYFRDTNFNPDQRRSFELHDYVTVFGEYSISDSFTARLEYTVWDDFRLTRQSWSDRVLQSVVYTEEERVNPRNFLQLRVRKTF